MIPAPLKQFLQQLPHRPVLTLLLLAVILVFALDNPSPGSTGCQQEDKGNLDIATQGAKGIAASLSEAEEVRPVNPSPLTQNLPTAELSTTAVRALCGRIGAKLSSVSQTECEQRNLLPTGALSVLGAPLVAVDYAPAQSAEGRVLLLGGIHGDEFSSVTIVFKWMAALETDPPSALHWRLLPLLNPDGLLRDTSQRMNNNGVDLNRNFPTPNGETEAGDYWMRHTGSNPRRYPGPRALSEPESRFLSEEIRRFRPDVIVAVHAPLEAVDFDGPREPPKKLGSLYLQRMGTYPGSLGRYGGEQMGVPVVTIELPRAGTMPSLAEQQRIWSDLIHYLERTLDPGRAALSSPAG